VARGRRHTPPASGEIGVVNAAAAFERLRGSSRPRILFVSHAYGGGVRRHIEELAAAIADSADVLLLTPRADRIEVRALTGDAAAWPPRADWPAAVGLLRAVGIDRVHFHHVHGLPREALELPQALGCGFDVTLHDHFPVCPQYHLGGGEARFCGGRPDCHRCTDANPDQWGIGIDAWRATFRAWLARAHRIIAPSEAAASRIREHFPEVTPSMWPHPEAAREVPPRALRVLVPGAISPGKGLPLLAACARDAAQRRLPLHFRVVGYIAYPVPIFPEAPLSVSGEYREGELPALLACEGGDVVFFPALCPETYSFTLSDAIDARLPIVATNLGALAERLAGVRDARLVPWDAPPGEINDALLAAARHDAAPRAAQPQVTFEDYARRYLEGLQHRAAAAAPVNLDPAWLTPPLEADPPTSTMEWLFQDAFACGRALSRGKLEARVREASRAPVDEIAVDVVIPVYRGEKETRDCVESVLKAVTGVRSEVVVIDDASPERALREWLRSLASQGRITLVEHGDNKGFVASASEGMALHPGRDVVLLNSDTEVAAGWLDRLRAHALRDPRIGTITPFTSNGTILGYPRPHVANPLPFGESTASLDARFAAANAGEAVDIPTAVGFCMYVTRRCIESVGVFDVARYGTGYGEEVDFCMRAVRAGLRNVAAADVFVRHVGEVSFRDAGVERRRRAQAIVDQLYPEFQPRLREFLARDPLAPMRARVDRSLAWPARFLRALRR
jgi:GT2 family glycosyltransferase/glycosyltransferase involved in cell wall biosynthesis